MNSILRTALPIVYLVLPAAVVGQKFTENSIPEPTPFSVIASDATADTSIIRSQMLIESDDSTAEFAVIDVLSPGGKHETGIRIMLIHNDRQDALYLDASQLSQLRDEIASFDKAYKRGETCDAIHGCVRGVARCRPSQVVRQAFCPSFFSTPDGKQGLALSTTRHSFRFPSTEPSVFLSTIDAAINALDLRQSGDASADQIVGGVDVTPIPRNVAWKIMTQIVA